METADRALIIEDDEKTASLVALYLQREGFETLVAHDGEAGIELARQKSPKFIVLDMMLPKKDGWDVCREVRKFSETPILMLTARGDEVDRITGLTLGADDYMVKPFSPRELVARMKAILRRTGNGRQTEAAVMARGGLTLDLEKRKAMLDGNPLHLTPHEMSLLKALMAAPGRIFTRQELLEHLYARGDAVVDRVVDVHVGKLRQKIEKDPARPRYILTVRGVGYEFAEQND